MNMGENIKKRAEQAGFKVHNHTEDSALLFFDMGNGRSQRVMLRYMGQDSLGQDILGISSPAMEFDKNIPLEQSVANRLLQDNSRLAHGAWAIEIYGSSAWLVILDTHIMDTMQDEELTASIRTVISSADNLEREFGGNAY